MGLCQKNLYLRRLVDAPSPVHVSLIIEEFRNDLKTRARRVIPH